MAKYRPSLYSTPMVKALLEDRKTQTRRLVKDEMLEEYASTEQTDEDLLEFLKVSAICPYGFVGDKLWVRETFARLDDGSFVYRANYPDYVIKWKPYRWKPSIHMPRKASRITLELTAIRIERLQEITASDAIAEGIELIDGRWRDYSGNYEGFEDTARINCYYGENLPAEVCSYASLWESINGRGSWKKNPFVWVYDFEKEGGQNG